MKGDCCCPSCGPFRGDGPGCGVEGDCGIEEKRSFLCYGFTALGKGQALGKPFEEMSSSESTSDCVPGRRPELDRQA